MAKAIPVIIGALGIVISKLGKMTLAGSMSNSTSRTTILSELSELSDTTPLVENSKIILSTLIRSNKKVFSFN